MILNFIKRVVRRLLFELSSKKRKSDILYSRVAKRRISFVEEILPKGAIGAELGVFKGHFSPVLFKHANTKELHLIDPFYKLSGNWEWAMGNKSTVDACIHILKIFKKEIEQRQVYLHIGSDLKVLPTFPDHYFDWVYIDATHEYEHTKKELELIVSKIKENGIIAGDDWRPDPSHVHHGVFKAVQEFLAKYTDYKIIYENEDTLQWALKKH